MQHHLFRCSFPPRVGAQFLLRGGAFGCAIGKDKIGLSAIDVFASSGSDDAFIWKGTAAFNSTSKGEVRYEKFDNRGTANDYTMVWIDNDADTGVEMAIRLTGLYNLAATDFIL